VNLKRFSGYGFILDKISDEISGMMIRVSD